MLTETQREQVRQGASEWGLTLDERALDRFTQFAALLEEANREFNLTRISPEDVPLLHFLDSLALAAVMKPRPNTHLLDIGTGAGFPGLPLAIVFPELKVTLLDSTRKRLNFLDSVIEALGLKNTVTLHGRAEELARIPEYRAAYPLITARAVAKMGVLAGWMLPLLAPGGTAIAYKSQDIAQELEDSRPILTTLDGKIERIEEITLPGTGIARKLVFLSRSVPPKSHIPPRHPKPGR